MTTWAELDAMLKRILETEDDATYSAELRRDAFNAAQQALAAHTAKTATANLNGDGSITEWSLPADCLETLDAIEAVQDQTLEKWLEPVKFVPGTEVNGEDDLPGFFLWPRGKIGATYAPSNGNILKLYYYAYWPDVTDSDSSVESPRWARPALMHYAAAYSFAPKGISAATLRQFNIKVDSGDPEDNPVHQQAKFHLMRFNEELKRFPPQNRGIGFTPGRAK